MPRHSLLAIQEWFRIHQYIRKLKVTPHFGQQRRLRILLIRITERARSRNRIAERARARIRNAANNKSDGTNVLMTQRK